jgi:hypothetical protein
MFIITPFLFLIKYIHCYMYFDSMLDRVQGHNDACFYAHTSRASCCDLECGSSYHTYSSFNLKLVPLRNASDPHEDNRLLF